jgi:hypothetical protein
MLSYPAKCLGGSVCRDESLPPLPLRESGTIEHSSEARKILGRLIDNRLVCWLCQQRSDRRSADLGYSLPPNIMPGLVSASGRLGALTVLSRRNWMQIPSLVWLPFQVTDESERQFHQLHSSTPNIFKKSYFRNLPLMDTDLRISEPILRFQGVKILSASSTQTRSLAGING